MSWRDFVTVTVVIQALAFLYNVVMGSMAFRKDSPRLFVWLVVVGVGLALSAGWMAAAQEHDSRLQKEQVDRLIANVTGGDSFPVIEPTIVAADMAHLELWNFGDAALTGVSASFSCLYPRVDVPRITIGTVPPHTAINLTGLLPLLPCRNSSPVIIKGERVSDWDIEITAQNGSYTEMLQFKRGDNCKNYSWRMALNSLGGVGFDAHHNLGRVADPKQLYVVPDWIGSEDCAPLSAAPPR